MTAEDIQVPAPLGGSLGLLQPVDGVLELRALQLTVGAQQHHPHVRQFTKHALPGNVGLALLVEGCSPLLDTQERVLGELRLQPADIAPMLRQIAQANTMLHEGGHGGRGHRDASEDQHLRHLNQWDIQECLTVGRDLETFINLP
jgi:hypothetical protein